ncbi:type II toxin-antitoxin system death-on-curing family toxin [Flavobacterium sp.]|uniref:type II toxin-antitoxin system death-on-curing family toxin n=1 Tax=Flavobacterium sp. TaxID=239 RepID=UPI0026191103|nr:type II toxin-antitoxin system death-on-curing family toxin [Flavobacterium sp.]
MAFIYFDTPHAIEIHDGIIIKSGGSLGVLDVGLLESTLDHVQNDLYYPNIEHKTTHIFHSVNKNHSFQDGNKRASIALAAYFLEINGFDYRVAVFMERMENIAVHVADNKIDKDLLFEIIQSIIYEADYSESLKLKVYKALMI